MKEIRECCLVLVSAERIEKGRERAQEREEEEE